MLLSRTSSVLHRTYSHQIYDPNPHQLIMSLEFENYPHEAYSLDAFSVACNRLLADENTVGDFVRFALTGGYRGQGGVDSHQAVMDPIQNALDNDHLVDVTRDYDSLLGLSSQIAFNKPITVYPAAKFEDTLSKNIHIKVHLQIHNDGVG